MSTYIWKTTAMAAWLLLGLALPTNESLAAEGMEALRAASKIKQIKEINKGYRGCLREALQQKNSAQGARDTVRRCREDYPAIGIYTECKREALKDKKPGSVDKADLTRCTQILDRARFNMQDPLPFFIYKQQLIFAGTGLNAERPIAGLNPPNFSCDGVSEAAQDLGLAQYFLFGNEPAVLAGDKPVPRDLLALLVSGYRQFKGEKKKSSAGNPYFDVKGFGRVYPALDKNREGVDRTLVYFPSAACHFDRPMGSLFRGLTIHALLDSREQAVFPFFGIAHYAEAGMRMPELVAAVRARLGEGYMAYAKDAQTVFVASEAFREVDAEGDPRNICKMPRSHRFVAIVRAWESRPQDPEYLIVANTENLCHYGDRLMRRWQP